MQRSTDIRYQICYCYQLHTIVHVLFHMTITAGDFTIFVGPDTLEASLAITVFIAISLASAKGVHITGPVAVIAPIDQVLVVIGDFTWFGSRAWGGAWNRLGVARSVAIINIFDRVAAATWDFVGVISVAMETLKTVCAVCKRKERQRGQFLHEIVGTHRVDDTYQSSSLSQSPQHSFNG
jgi:hypothetical protein